MESRADLIYSSPQSRIKDFTFDAQVADVFPDMIKRSVPGYNTIIETIGRLSRQYVTDNSNVYDLGCSLGAATLAMRQQIKAKSCKIWAVDNSPAMVERCQKHLNAFKSDIDYDVIIADIQQIDITNASMVVLNFTLQFLEPEQRTQLLARIYQGLNKGGILVLSEKIAHQDAICNELLNECHLDFKRANGYSELEIAQKRTALENVMRIDTLLTQQQRLQQAGFEHYTQWFQCFNFTSLIAIK
jgi:tRNA (cmo5U34)-methyltransferase